MKVVELDHNILVIKFQVPTPEFYPLLNAVKNGVDGRSWDPATRSWRAIASEKNMTFLKGLGFQFSPAAEARMAPPPPSTKVHHIGTAVKDLAHTTIDETKLKGFFPFQVEGVRFLESREGSGLIGDEMGLGKTVQALGYLKLHPDIRPALVVCPATVKYVWVDAARQWAGFRKSEIHIFSSRDAMKPRVARPIYVINYDILKDWEEVIEQLGIRIIVGDEVQYVSNDKALRTKSFVRLAKQINKKVFLSGTPIKSYPVEFFTVLNLLDPHTFPNRWKYQERYCDPKHNGFGWTFKGASNQEELRELITPLMIRREKAEVLPELPPKLKQVVPLDCDEVELKAYADASDVFKQWVKDNINRKSSAEAKNQVEHLKQLAYLAKRNSVLRWIKEFLATGHKLVVFCIHKHVMDDIEAAFKDQAVRIDGHVKVEDREGIVKRFQTDPSVRLFIGQSVAAGVGITLTVASSVGFIEYPWTNADLDQDADRCHRIGQKDTVNIYYLTANGTIENKIIRHLDTNRGVVRKLLDGKEVEDCDLLESLLDDYMKDEGEVEIDNLQSDE